jgi:glucose/arabinose dehydrogenase
MKTLNFLRLLHTRLVTGTIDLNLAGSPLKLWVKRHAMICAASILASLSALPAHAAGPTTIISGASQRCLDVAGADQTPRTPTIIYDCHGGANQMWEFTAAGELRTFGGTRCLDVRGASIEPRAIVQSYTCHGGANQKWSLRSDGTIVNAQSGLCMTVLGGATANETGVDMWPCGGLAHQRWSTAASATPDTQPPTQPTGLSISGLACRSVTLTWKASTDNVGVASYDIYHDGQSLGTVNGGTLSSLLTLTPGANWGLYVNARDAAGNLSKSSDSLQIQVPQCQIDTQAPTVPTGLKGSTSGTTATLSWDAATDNIAVTAYDIYRDNVKIGATAALSYTDSGLAANKTYQYAVAARDAQNNASPRSVTLSLTTGSSCTTAVCSVNQVATDTDIPWGLVALPDGTVLYSRRDAHDVVRLDPATGAKTKVGDVPNVQGTDGEGGLLGLAITSNFPDTDPWLYIYHTSPTDNRIVRIQYKNGALDSSTLQVLLGGIKRSKYHNGGRLRFGPDGKLYATAGDAESKANAQDKNSLSGKVLRLNPDGSKPSDNPFNNYVWSFGHRNPQGLAFDSQGRLWEQEFGDSQDETNLIVKGGNYGWPDCEGTISRAGGGCATAGYIAPKYTYQNYEGSCSGIAIVRDALYVACLAGKRVYRSDIGSGSLSNVQQLFVNAYDRLRTVEPAIDGNLWMANSDAAGDKDSIPNNTNTKIFKVILGK